MNCIDYPLANVNPDAFGSFVLNFVLLINEKEGFFKFKDNQMHARRENCQQHVVHSNNNNYYYNDDSNNTNNNINNSDTGTKS